ncbi:MAG: C1 family peptidase [Lactobacillus sp.]|jgi:aminopeptidase C|nr:C1 family peptidase [Lactobacillus sp.]
MEPLDFKKIAQISQGFTPQNEIAKRAAIRTGVLDASFNTDAVAKLNRTFSIEVKTGAVTNQKHSGRCWLFSLLNTLRHNFASTYNVKDFELSQGYLYFWDKIERANIFYDHIIETADLPADDRQVAFYLAGPGDDGGQWAMAAALVQKYGLVPNYAMPETFNTNNTTGFAAALNKQLRHDAIELRQLVQAGATDSALAAKKQALLAAIYRMTVIAVGEPTQTFDLEYRDDDHQYHLDENLTPQQFRDKYFKINLDDYVVLTNSPDKALNKRYTLPSQNNIVGGKAIEFVNVAMPILTKAAIAQLKAGETVWFGNDVLAQMHRKEGLLDDHLYETDALFDTKSTMTKAQRLQYHEGSVSHAMTLTGVDLIHDQPTKWRVENSWGKDNGQDGYFVMNNGWFNEFVYEVVVNKQYVPADTLALLTQPATVLPVWDSLA